MNIRIGIAPDSWGVWFPNDPKQPPWQRFLDEVVEAGYEWIELGPYGYLPTDLPTLQAELDKRGLKASSAYAGGDLEKPAAWPEFEKQVRDIGTRLVALGAKYLVLSGGIYTDPFTGKRTGPSTLDESAWKYMIGALFVAVVVGAARATRAGHRCRPYLQPTGPDVPGCFVVQDSLRLPRDFRPARSVSRNVRGEVQAAWIFLPRPIMGGTPDLRSRRCRNCHESILS